MVSFSPKKITPKTAVAIGTKAKIKDAFDAGIDCKPSAKNKWCAMTPKIIPSMVNVHSLFVKRLSSFVKRTMIKAVTPAIIIRKAVIV